MPRDSVARNPVQKFYPVGKAATVAGGADPGRGAERFSEGLLCGEPAANQWFRIRVLRDVAYRPIVKTGANVPSYSGGGAAAWWFRGWFFSNPLFPSLAGFQFSVFLISAFSFPNVSFSSF